MQGKLLPHLLCDVRTLVLYILPYLFLYFKDFSVVQPLPLTFRELGVGHLMAFKFLVSV
jgi:hypothetical protein